MHLHNIKSIGVELEGAWDSRPPSASIYGDGSVEVSGAYRSGEIQSPGMQWDALKPWIVANYPHHVDRSCGLHIHVMLTTLGAYMGTMEKGFISFLKKKLKQFGRDEHIPIGSNFWYRLDGRNHYCRDLFHADAQAVAEDKVSERYAMVNWCFKLHGTIEIRVLPMWTDSAQALRACECVLLAIAAYSRKRKHCEKIASEKIRIRQDNTTGGEVICV